MEPKRKLSLLTNCQASARGPDPRGTEPVTDNDLVHVGCVLGCKAPSSRALRLLCPFPSLCLGLLPRRKEIIVVILGLNLLSCYLFSICPVCVLYTFSFFSAFFWNQYRLCFCFVFCVGLLVITLWFVLLVALGFTT